MHRVVVLDSELDLRQRRGGVQDRTHSDVVALQGFDEGFGHAVALRALDRGDAGLDIECQGTVDRLLGGKDRAVVGEPLQADGPNSPAAWGARPGEWTDPQLGIDTEACKVRTATAEFWRKSFYQ